MFFLTDPDDKPVAPRAPLPVRDVGVGSEIADVTSEVITFITGAAGFARVVPVLKGPILNKTGDRVAKFWKSPENQVDGSDSPRYTNLVRPTVTSIVETATAAAAVINNPYINMEQLFETPSGVKDYVLVMIDASGNELYGWIAGIAASGDVYTFTLLSTPSGATQTWVGSTSTFDSTGAMTYKIFKYDTSFSWGTGTVLTREVEYKLTMSDEDQLAAMSNGDFAIDYARNRILYKKATTGTSDTAIYKVKRTLSNTSFTGSSTTTPGSTTEVTTQLKKFQDTNFVTGDSPATLDVNAALGRNSVNAVLRLYGAGDITVEVSTDGTTFESSFILPAGDTLDLTGYSLDTMRLSWIADTKYLLLAR